MKFVAVIKGKQVVVEINKEKGLYCLTIDDKGFTVDAFRPTRQSLSMLIEGKSYEVGLERNGNTFTIYFFNDTVELDLIDFRKFQAATADVQPAGDSSGLLKIQAPMPGKIVKVSVQEQTVVNEGDSLLVMEAMKMQNELKAPKAGVISRIQVVEGEP